MRTPYFCWMVVCMTPVVVDMLALQFSFKIKRLMWRLTIRMIHGRCTCLLVQYSKVGSLSARRLLEQQSFCALSMLCMCALPRSCVRAWGKGVPICARRCAAAAWAAAAWGWCASAAACRGRTAPRWTASAQTPWASSCTVCRARLTTSRSARDASPTSSASAASHCCSPPRAFPHPPAEKLLLRTAHDFGQCDEGTYEQYRETTAAAADPP